MAVELRQAGQELACRACQHRFEAPKLRELKSLPLAGTEQAAHPGGTGSRRIHGSLFSLGLALLLLAGSAGGGLYWYSAKLIPEETPDEVIAIQVERVRTQPIVQVYYDWETLYKERNVPEWQESGIQSDIKQGGYLRAVSFGLFAVAGIGVLTLVAALFTGPRS